MKARIGRWTIATRLFVLQVAAIVVLTAIATLWLWSDAQADVNADADAKTLVVATAVADNPFVLDAVQSPDPSATLQPYALTAMADTSTDFITIMAPDRTRYTHPDPSQIGKPFQGTIEPALEGRTFTETYAGTLGPSVRSVAPVFSSDGRVVALVSAGVTVSSLGATLSSRLPIVFGIAALTLALGALASWLLSRYLRRVTWGLGAEEMSRMFGYYEGVLHSVREGVILTDPHGNVVLYNDQAAELLGLARQLLPASPSPVAGFAVPDGLRQLLASGAVAVDEPVLTDDRVLIVNQSPAISSATAGAARRIGTMTTLRDHTELQQLTGELTTMRTLSDALRSQTHEFSNRLHTIIALIELDRRDEALAFASNELHVGQTLVDEVIGSVDEPVLAALLLGKSAQASERGVEFDVRVDDGLDLGDLPPVELVTIIGNLVDNALDAGAGDAGAGGTGAVDACSVAAPNVAAHHPKVVVAISCRDHEVMITVTDNGPGITDLSRAFTRGYSTKDPGQTGRGIGLALVEQSVRRLGGDVVASNVNAAGTPGTGVSTGASFTVTLPITKPSRDQTGPGQTGLEQTGPGRTGPGQTGLGQAASESSPQPVNSVKW
ncbi:sensor histidine kinase [Subtercola sp. PAMC28395]|uniref:sensor histidine kinase n=1 Tax=Subtercola sp. PAMC28395 TaxID=2846775 RepID=UPI001C0CCA51|nr:sensor histidine kinase [Subtercola sp. PAMC28395]QWT23670.1 sensor histidine kinase [Subtercola sp. PAMC28395]